MPQVHRQAGEGPEAMTLERLIELRARRDTLENILQFIHEDERYRSPAFTSYMAAQADYSEAVVEWLEQEEGGWR